MNAAYATAYYSDEDPVERSLQLSLIEHEQAQVAFRIGTYFRAGRLYEQATSLYADISQKTKIRNNQFTVAEVTIHLQAQRILSFLKALTSDDQIEVKKAKKELLWLRHEKIFDYKNPADYLNLAYKSYHNGDCRQAARICNQVEYLLSEHEIFDLRQAETHLFYLKN